MDAILGLIGKFVGVSARIGAPFMVLAMAVYLLRRYGVEPFASLENSNPLFQGVMTLGVLGAATVMVGGIVGAWNGGARLLVILHQQWITHKTKRQRQSDDLQNLRAAPSRYIAVLRFLKRNDMRRLYASTSYPILIEMERARLLTVDPAFWRRRNYVYYVVPSHIWDAIEGEQEAPEKPPWQVGANL